MQTLVADPLFEEYHTHGTPPCVDKAPMAGPITASLSLPYLLQVGHAHGAVCSMPHVARGVTLGRAWVRGGFG